VSKNKNHEISLQDLPKSIQAHIKQLEQVRQDFVANVSHELRTPLTVIRGYIEVLLTKQPKGSDDKKALDQMLEHSLRMEHIINDLLFLSKLDSSEQPIQHKPINVATLLESVVQDAQKISGDKKHDIVLEADTALTMDGAQEELKSLFSNLIINAVKYTPPGGKIVVRWYCENGSPCFSVMDTGIGIAKSHIPRLTERFYRVDKARSRDSGGTGLGLAIVKHVLMRHQGTLFIDSTAGKGSTFRCIFD